MKKVLMIFVIILILALAGIFIFKSCEVRTKTDDDSTENTENLTEEEDTESSTASERNDSPIAEADIETKYRPGFINANIEFTCELLKNPALLENSEEISQKINETYAKHGLPVDNNEGMIAILQKYEQDAEIIALITENSAPCKNGEEGIFVE